MSENLVDDLERLAAFARVSQGAAGTDPGDGPFDGTDGSGAVTVSIERDGTLLSIAVADGWSDLLGGPDQLTGAIRAAMASATSARMGLPQPTAEDLAKDWSDFDMATEVSPMTAEVTEEDRARVEEMTQEQLASISATASTATVDEVTEQLRQQLERLTAALQGVGDISVAGGRELVSENRMVRLQFNAFGFLDECTIQSSWARNQSGKSLTMTFAEMLQG